MIGFVVAMEKEAKLFLDRWDNYSEQVIATKRVFVGEYIGNEAVLIIAGIGKVNAGFSTQIIIDKFAPKSIINFGVAGGKSNSGLKAGDVVLLDKICQYDFDLSEIDDVSIGYMQDYDTVYYNTNVNMYKGDAFKVCSCATGDRFTKNKYFLNIIMNLSAQVVDMESGAIVQVTHANNVPFLSIKLISDVDDIDESIFAQYQSNVQSICDKIPNAIEELLSNMDYNNYIGEANETNNFVF